MSPRAFGPIVILAASSSSLAPAQCPDFGADFAIPGVAEWSNGVHPDERVNALAHFDSGAGPMLYVGGNCTLAGEVEADYIAMWDGAQWNAVGASDALTGEVEALQVFDDGSGSALFVGGMFATVEGQPSRFVAKWTGTSWVATPGLNGPGSFARALDFALFDDGGGQALFVGGTITTVNGLPCGGVAKWTGSGWTAIDPSFPGSEVSELEVYDVGGGPRLFIGGFINAVFGGVAHSICSWDGASFQPLGSGLDSYVTALGGFDDGSGPKLFVGGYFGTAGGVAAQGVARWDGSTWESAGTLGPDQPFAFGAFDEGAGPKLIAGCMPYGAWPYDETLMQWDGADWQIYRGATAHSGAVFDVHVADDGSGHGDELYIGGQFVRAGPARALRVARLRNLQWQSIGDGDGKASHVSALAEHDDGTGPAVYSSSGETPSVFPMTAGDRVERWDGTTWIPLGDQTDSGSVHALRSCDLGGGAELYAGGKFAEIDGVAVDHVARWDGGAWNSLSGGLGASQSDRGVQALLQHDDGSGERLFVAGEFSSAGGVSVGGIAAWNGASWSDVGGGMDAIIYALAVYDSGNGPELYAGGGFSTAGGIAANRVARWDGSAWHAVGGGMGGSQQSGVFALAVFDDGNGEKLYAGGKFTLAGGATALRIAAWDGTIWSPVGSGANNLVDALAVHDDGFGAKLYAGGTFTSIGGVAAERFARWTGTQWQALPGVTGGGVDTLLSFEPAPGRHELWLAGGFTRANGRVASRVARWDETGPCDPTPYCTAKVNSAGCVPSIFWSGSASVTGNSFRVKAANVLNNKSGLLFWGLGALDAPFQGGTLCVRSPIVRTPVQDSGGNAPPDDCSGEYSFHWSASYMASRGLGAGQRIFCQHWSRDPASPSTTGLSDGLSFLIEP